MMPHFSPGAVVLYDNGWNHNQDGRPFVVVSTCPSRGLRLCPISSTGGDNRPEPPIPPRAGGLRHKSWVAATDTRSTTNQLLWVDPAHVGRRVCWLNAAELAAVKLTAAAQLIRRKARSRSFVTV